MHLTVVDKTSRTKEGAERIDAENIPMVQDLSRFRLPPGFRGRSALVVQLWWLVQGTLFAMSPQALYGWRNALLRLFGCKVGRDVIIRPSVRITYPWKVSIGDRSWIGDNAELYSLGEITIGTDAVVSQQAYLCTASHDHRAIGFDIYAKPIVIEDQAWVCTGVFVHPGVRIGKGAVIAARSVLKQDAEPFGIYSGFPAELQGRRTLRANPA
jgi:putative colanic acid biosynthesis acetyltransferase WcaF